MKESLRPKTRNLSETAVNKNGWKILDKAKFLVMSKCDRGKDNFRPQTHEDGRSLRHHLFRSWLMVLRWVCCCQTSRVPLQRQRTTNFSRENRLQVNRTKWEGKRYSISGKDKRKLTLLRHLFGANVCYRKVSETNANVRRSRWWYLFEI